MRLLLLGPLEIVDDDGAVPLGGLMERRLLAALGVNAGEVVAESRLIDALWGENPPRTAIKTLQNYILRLRKVLRPRGADPGGADPRGADLVIETAAPGYRLRARPGAVDAAAVGEMGARARAAIGQGQYRQAATILDEALRYWRGASLCEFADEPFAEAEALRLDSLRQAMLEDQIEVALARGHHHDCIAQIEALLVSYPMRERLWGQLMVALYRSGRQADALRAYQSVRAHLVEHVGIEPGPELRQLERAVIHQDPELDFTHSEKQPGHPEYRLPPEMAGVGEASFVGRQEEMVRLTLAWQQACRGQKQAVFLSGEPGIGKTSLARELAAHVHKAGGIVLYGRNDEDFGVPYQPLAEALRWHATCSSTETVVAQAGPLANELALLVPELAATVPRPPPVALAEPELARQRLFDAVATVLAAASLQAPLLLIVDDLHWAAKPTLMLLRHILRPSESARVLIIGTYRSTDLGQDHPLSHTLAELHRELSVQRVALNGLSESEALELVAERAGEDRLDDRGVALARGLHGETSGNPFFMSEILRHLVETGWLYRHDGRWTTDHNVDALELPAGVREVVGQRLSHLTERSQRAISVAAVVGATFSLDVLEAVPDAADDADALLDALDEAVRAFIVAEVDGQPGRYSFAHAVVRQALLAALTSTRRARLHRRVGEAIERLPEPEKNLAALARHFSEAGIVSKAISYAERAGIDARKKLAFEEAAVHFAGGLALLDGQERPDLESRADLLLALAETLPLTGDRRGAVAAAVRAAGDARAVGSPERLARAAMLHASLGVAGRPDPAVGPLCEEALDRLGDEPSVLRAKVTARLAQHRALWAGQGIEAGALAEEAVRIARHTGDLEALHVALYVRAITLVGSERVDERLALAEELHASEQGAGDVLMHASGLRLRALARLELGDVAGFDDDLRQVEQLALTRRRRQFLSETARWRALRALLDGRFADVETHSAEMLVNAGDDANAKSAHICQMFFLRRDQGRLEEARLMPERAVEQTPGLVTLQAMIALADAEMGHFPAAAKVLSSLARDGFAPVHRDFTWTASLSTLAGVCDALADAERAAVLLDLFRPHHGHLVVMGWGDVCPGSVDRHLGILAATVGRSAEARYYFESALAVEERLGAIPSLTRTRIRFAPVLAVTDVPRAHALLTVARADAERLGMLGLAAEAATLTSALWASRRLPES